MSLQSKIVRPEPETLVSALSPQSAVRVLPDGRLVAGQVRLAFRIGVLGLIDGVLTPEVRDPVGTEEADADREEGERHEERRGYEQRVGETHLDGLL